MLKPGNYSKRLKTAREARGLEWTDVPPLAGIDPSAYLDLESNDDEITLGVSANEVARVLACLKLTPFELFEADKRATREATSYDALAQAIEAHLARTLISAEAFGTAVGWDIRESLRDPKLFGGLPLDALSDICEPVGIDWRGLLK